MPNEARSPRGVAGQEKGQLWEHAIRRLDEAIASGFFLEAIALADSLITDRLESIAHVNQEVVDMAALGRALTRALKSSPDEIGRLEADLRQWGKGRNRCLHQMAKHSDSWPGSWSERLETAAGVAVEGKRLVRVVDEAARRSWRSPQRVSSSSDRLRILSADDPADLEDWQSLWQGSRLDPQASVDYCLAMSEEPSTLRCAVFGEGAHIAMMPFHLRDIRQDDNGLLRDAITPYGYGGSFAAAPIDTDAFWAEWKSWAVKSNVVSLTVRGHPIEGHTLAVPGESHSPFHNVAVDTSMDSEAMWQSMEGRVRTDVRRARREGVVVELDEDCSRLVEFHQVYTETMEAHEAAGFYFFSLQSLAAMVEGLAGHVVLAHAILDGKIVASEMNLLGDRTAYYFLSGARPEARASRANPLMKVEVMNWLHDRGYDNYLLGGGLGHDDSLFRYKRGYAPNGIVPFELQYLVTLPDVAEDLLAERKIHEPDWTPQPGFFPPYRAPGVERAVQRGP